MLKVIIADDEEPARSRMTRLLQKIDGVEVVNVSSNGLDAYENITLLKPDAVFLDIEMPGMTGVQIASVLPEDLPTRVVFTTAYNDYALKAFELNAVDYLTKPIEEERLRAAVEKLKKNASHSPIAAAKVLEDLRQEPLNKIPVALADRYKLLDFEEILCVEVVEKETLVHTLQKAYIVSAPLEHYEKKLPPQMFMRISRSAIVQLKAIKEVVLWFGNRYKIVLVNGKELLCSRERSKSLKSFLKL
jgi:DNA-binding LytR/AlgR family response regulator